MKSNTKSFYHLTFSSCTTDFRTPLSTFGVGSALLGIKHKKTTRYSPWQNCYAERWIKTCRNEFLDFFIPINQYHLEKNLTEFVHFYNHHRTPFGPEQRQSCFIPCSKTASGCKAWCYSHNRRFVSHLFLQQSRLTLASVKTFRLVSKLLCQIRSDISRLHLNFFLEILI